MAEVRWPTTARSMSATWRRCAVVGLVGALALAACSSGGSGGGSGADDPALPVGSDPGAVVATDAVADSSPVTDSTDTVGDDLDEGAGDVGDTTLAEPVVDDVVIPVPTTDPPVVEGPDAPPPVEAASTTAAPVPLPDPDDVGRIVSLSPTHTEILFALGLGEFVVAVDAGSYYPPEALAVRRGNLVRDTADLSAVFALEPDVVVLGIDNTRMVDRFSEAGVASYSGPPARSLDDVYAQIEGVAAIVGRPDLADDLIGRMQADIEAIKASLPDVGGEPLTVFHEIDPSLFAVADDGFLSSIYAELGLVNIAGPSTGNGVTQLTSDEVIAADPDVIVLADGECCGVTADVLANRPGWSEISAIRSGAVVVLPDALIENWGPRVVDIIRLAADGVIAAAG